ncbi:type II toxin-antitoxin system PemK/MazF family toxin [uncultured Desulfovibrio sp.]|uniref:type II toxin-antitoxin system PemK/MazF family toxin n=1 Tax=uncultured Desulfovibrio sp. TaxID=167968 RepID=UPI0025E9467D|nr:type II toxin-antitoxin system PemK/MazF family toxin [uncultured Desulfovibrio sp.]
MAPKTISRFEIWWANLDPTIGHEIKKTRPVVVVSPDELNRHLATVLVAPLTSTIRPYPFRVNTVVSDVPGQIALDQIRALDKIRLIKRIESLQQDKWHEVISVLQTMFGE